MPSKPKQPATDDSPRRAYWCETHKQRQFLIKGQEIPECSICKRKMVRQGNNVYFGRPT